MWVIENSVNSIIKDTSGNLKNTLSVQELEKIRDTFAHRQLQVQRQSWADLQTLLVKIWNTENIVIDEIVDRNSNKLNDEWDYFVADSLRSGKKDNNWNVNGTWDFHNKAKSSAWEEVDGFVWARTLYTIDQMIRKLKEKPETKEPVTKEPETKEPVTKEPDTKEPVTKEPDTKEPDTKEPETKEPDTKEPETKEPVTKEPDTKEPETKEPVTSVPVPADFRYERPWHILLEWRDLDWKIDMRELTPEMKNLIRQYEKLGILNSIINIWITRAKDVSDSLLFKRFRDSWKNIELVVKEIEAKFINIQKNIGVPWYNPDADIDWIFWHMQTWEWEKSIIWSSDLTEIKTVFDDTRLSKDQKLIKIYNLMRYKWVSWNSQWVKDEVANMLLSKNEFKNVNVILTNTQTIEYIKNWNISELVKLWITNEKAQEIVKAYNKINLKNQKSREEYNNQLPTINAQRKTQWLPEYNNVDEYITAINEASILYLLKHNLIRNNLEQRQDRWSEENSYEWVYANLTWLAQNNWWFNDVFVISDENVDHAIDVWVTVALSAVSMWAWALVARWAMMWIWALWRTARLGSIANRLNSWTKIAGATRFIWTAWIEWTAFYEWTNVINNIIYNEWNIFENWANLKEISKSIAFMWVLRWVWKVMQDAKIASALREKPWVIDWINLWKVDLWMYWNTMAKIWDLTAKVPPMMLKWESVTWILAEAWLLTWTSQWLEVAFWEDLNLTWEEYLQAVVMIWLFRWVWKIWIKRAEPTPENPKWEIKLIEYNPRYQIETKEVQDARNPNKKPEPVKPEPVKPEPVKPEPIIDKEFVFPENGTPMQYKLTLDQWWQYKISVKNAQWEFVEANWTNLPTWFMKDRFDARVQNELKKLRQNSKSYWSETGMVSSKKEVLNKNTINFENKNTKNLLSERILKKNISEANNSISNLWEWEKIYLWTKIEWNHLEITKTTDWYNLQVYENWNISWQQISATDVPSIKIPTKEWFIIPELNYWNWQHYWNIKEVLFSIK